jgi:glutamyl/glutaminyl-tRNA synthetase
LHRLHRLSAYRRSPHGAVQLALRPPHRRQVLLRIEDTDRERSTEPAIKAILDGLKWLELDWDDEPIYQAARAQRHREVAEELLAAGKAYRCYASPEELSQMREAAKKAGRSSSTMAAGATAIHPRRRPASSR